jgi:hypothetical protein
MSSAKIVVQAAMAAACLGKVFFTFVRVFSADIFVLRYPFFNNISKNMNVKIRIGMLACLLLCCTAAHGAKKTFEREYTYRASDADSKITARDNTVNELRKLLLREVGEYIQAQRSSVDGEYSENMEAITAGVVNLKIIHEDWDGKTYWAFARIVVDPDDVLRRVEEIRKDKSYLHQLEQERQKRIEAEAQLKRLRQEADIMKAELDLYKDAAQRAEHERQYQEAKQKYEVYVVNNFTVNLNASTIREQPKDNKPAPAPSKTEHEKNSFWYLDYRYSPTSPFGLSTGVACRWIGIYTSMKIHMAHNINDISEIAYTIKSADMSSKRVFQRGSLLLGVMLGWKYVYLYGGAGYGYYWTGHAYSGNGKYYGVSYDKLEDWEIELGLMLRLKYVTINAGINIIDGSGYNYLGDITIGLGFAIPF